MRLLVASTNPGKIAEIRAILAGLPIEIVTPDAFPAVVAPVETGVTFEDNARLKAVAYAEATGLLAASDDSGLEIDALGGAPGVHSARYNGETYDEKFRTIYTALRELPDAPLTARFVCVVALARPGRLLFTARATVDGLVAPAPRGQGGFGYDPIFFYPPYGKTLAELDPVVKSNVSHRGKAFRALRQFLADPTGLEIE